MRKRTGLPWIPLWSDKWIFGSTRLELEPAERAVWVDFLALGAKDDGYIRANETTPYPHYQLAAMLNLPLELLESSIEKFIKHDKLEDNNGIYRIKNWDKYQLSERHQQRLTPKADTMSGKTDTMSRKRTPCPKNGHKVQTCPKNGHYVQKTDTMSKKPDAIEEKRREEEMISRLPSGEKKREKEEKKYHNGGLHPCTRAAEHERKRGVSHPSKTNLLQESASENEGTSEKPIYHLQNRANKVVSLKEALQEVEQEVKRKMEARGIDLDSIPPEKQAEQAKEG